MSYTLVTGASSGIGKSLALSLAREGRTVYGLGRTFPASMGQVPGLTPVTLNLLDTPALLHLTDTLQAQDDIDLLVLCAGAAYYGLHEELNPAKIQEMVRVNLEVPLLLTQRLLRPLKKTRGTIVLVSSVTAHLPSPHGCAYAATKAALSSFGESLFDEARRYGVRVITVSPDMTDTQLYRHADFGVDADPAAHLEPEDVAEAVLFALRCGDRFVMREITLRPQLHRIARKPRGGKPESPAPKA